MVIVLWTVRTTLKQSERLTIYPSLRRSMSGLGREICHKDAIKPLAFDPRMLDEAALWLLDVMQEPAGLTISGRTACLNIMHLALPAFRYDDPRTPTRWLIDLIDRWRYGDRHQVAVACVRARFALNGGTHSEWVAL